MSGPRETDGVLLTGRERRDVAPGVDVVAPDGSRSPARPDLSDEDTQHMVAAVVDDAPPPTGPDAGPNRATAPGEPPAKILVPTRELAAAMAARDRRVAAEAAAADGPGCPAAVAAAEPLPPLLRSALAALAAFAAGEFPAPHDRDSYIRYLAVPEPEFAMRMGHLTYATTIPTASITQMLIDYQRLTATPPGRVRPRPVDAR